MKKNIIFMYIFCTFIALSYSNSIKNKQKLLFSESWLYDAIYILSTENKESILADIYPMSYEEYYFYFSKIDYSRLSENSKKLYKEVESYLSKEEVELDFSPLKIGINLRANLNFNYKSNDSLTWSYNNPYSGRKYFDYNDNEYKEAQFGDISFLKNTNYYKPFLELPIYLNFSDLIYIQTEPMLGKSYWGMIDNKNFTNIAYQAKDFDFLWPRTAYLNTGYIFNDDFGINFQLGKDGFQFGRTSTGSIIYNNTFETDAYSKLNLYTQNFKFETNVVQVNKERYMYLHSFELNLFKRIRFGLIEGTFVNDDFELRFLNPLMIMHSFGAWEQYASEVEKKYYVESKVCQYIGFTFDIIPFKNCRIYALYAQNEIQPPNELKTPYGKSLPNSIAGQFGIEYYLPHKNNNWFIFNLEALYTSPYMYLKAGRDWSLISYRSNMLKNKATPIYSWIGSPFGPDTIALEAKISYKQFNKFEFDFSYLFVAHGENNFSIFNSIIETEDGIIYAYFPSALRILEELSDEESEKKARDMSLSGIIQYSNQFKFHASYNLNKNFKLDSEIIYMLILNHNNIKTNFINNIQFSIGLEYKLF